jgi:microcystin-dependent protein
MPYVGEIRMFAGTFAPAGWALCNGAPMAISENDILFTLIGTTYGGDGQSTFNLPDLQSRVPLHNGTLNGTPFILGEAAGVEQVTLSAQTMPVHSHPFMATNDIASTPNPQGNVLGRSSTVNEFIITTPTLAMNAQMLAADGGSQPHTNIQPYLCINFIISLFGVYPSPS